MTIEAEHLESWIGAEVVDPEGEKLGKIAEVYFRDAEPLIVEIRSGLAGRKHHLAALRGARVSRDHVRVAQSAVVPARGPLDAEQLGELAAYDERLRGLAPDAFEAWSDRVERLNAAGEAQARADSLEAEASKRVDAEITANTAARDASGAAEAARLQREAAEAQAEAARAEAERRR